MGLLNIANQSVRSGKFPSPYAFKIAKVIAICIAGTKSEMTKFKQTSISLYVYILVYVAYELSNHI